MFKKIAGLFAFLLLMGPWTLSFAYQAQQNTGLSSTPSEADSVLIMDKGWPRSVELEEGTIIFHQPQIYKWDNFTDIGCWVATEIVPKDEKLESFVGSLKVEAKTETDLESRAVLIFDKKLVELKLDGSDPELTKKIEARLRSISTSPEIMSLDRIIPMVDESIFDFKGEPGNTEAPTIFYSDRGNSILVIVDGDPIWAPTENDNIKFAVNTNWPLFSYEKENLIFLLNEGSWLEAVHLKGPWEETNKLPKDFKKLAKKEGWEDLKAVIPAKASGKPIPKIFASTRPAELLLLMGAPKFKAIDGAEGLKSVYNTDADLFFYSGNDQYYFLVSGRWFRSASLEGPWVFATPELPQTFSKIPEDSDWGHVLSSVPGTIQAKEAVIQAQIPQTAELKRDAKAPEVKYNGEPKFVEIEGTDMKYATNTEHDIIYVEDKYYMCYQGAWFVSPYPTYGWGISTYVPAPIYTIPPTYPIYHVSYVHCYGYTSSHVRFGYSAGYMGIHVSYGVPFYGTGYYYSPYSYYPMGYGYPVYYPYHYSYGFRATYNPYTGTYARSARVYGPYGGAGRGASYNPRTGTYARGRSAWGPYGGVGEAVAYNPRTGARGYGRTAQGWNEGRTEAGGFNARTGGYGATRQGHNPYAQWGESVVGRGDSWAHTGHYTDSKGTRYGFKTSEGAAGIGYRDQQGNQGRVVKGKDGDLYVGNNGNVYKRDGDTWHKNDKGKWNEVPRENQLNQEQRNQIQNRAQNAERPNLSQADRDKARSQIENQKTNRQADRQRTQPRTNNQAPRNNNYRSQVPNRDYNARQRGSSRSNNYNNYQRQRNYSAPSRSMPRGGRSMGGRRG